MEVKKEFTLITHQDGCVSGNTMIKGSVWLAIVMKSKYITLVDLVNGAFREEEIQFTDDKKAEDAFVRLLGPIKDQFFIFRGTLEGMFTATAIRIDKVIRVTLKSTHIRVTCSNNNAEPSVLLILFDKHEDAKKSFEETINYQFEEEEDD